MTQGGSQSLHLSGSKVNTTNAALDVNATNAVQHMKQELGRLQAENQKLVDQLNCFISLVQRSWKGDRHATIHLSNIIGIDPPKQQGPSSNDGLQARPNSEMNVKNRVEQNWERLAMKLLEREYQEVQREIREYQQRYIQNRQAYMDAVLQDHQHTMSVIPLSRQHSNGGSNNNSHALENVDTRFITHSKAIQRMGLSHNRRAQSAKVRARSAKKDEVKAMDISLKDLVGDMPSSGHFVDTEALRDQHQQHHNQHRTITPFQNSNNSRRRPQTSHPRLPPNAYNDPARYTKGDVYDVREADGVKKPRPVSASSLREADAARSLPRSGSFSKREKGGPHSQAAFITQKNERSLRYEATKPVYVFPKQSSPSKPRRNSDERTTGPLIRSNSHSGLMMMMPQADVIHASSAARIHPADHQHFYTSATAAGGMDNNGGAEQFVTGGGGDYAHNSNYDDHENGFEYCAAAEMDPAASGQTKPPISIRVKSAHTRRPAHIDKFADEERALRDMEADFKKTALTLQKKLGLEETGIITLE